MPKSSLVSPDRLEFTYDACGDPQRIIIKEITDASKVKLYDKETNVKFLCIGCRIGQNVKNHSHIINSRVHEPGFHLCKPISVNDCACGRATIDDLRNLRFVSHDDSTTSSSSNQVPATRVEQDHNVTRNDCMPPPLEKYDVTLRENLLESPAKQNNLDDPMALMASDSQLTNPPELTRASPVIQIETDLLSESSAFSVSHSQTTLIGRKVKRGDYEYGYGSNNKKRNKVVVFEDNRDFVRVYNYSNGEWHCNGCFLINDQKLCGYFKKNFFHPPSHHLCEPINRQEYVEDQQKIKEIISRNLATSKASKSQTHESLNDTVEEVQASQNSTATEESSTTPRLNRIVDLFNFEYSFNELAERKKRITIYEVDRKYVRQYKITENEMWYCINCQTACIKKSDDDKVEIYGDHQCDPILASEYKVSDKLLLEKSYALKNGSKNASSAMPKSSNLASSSNGSSSKLCTSKKIADTNLSSSSNAHSLRKLEFYEWMFKSNDRSHIIVFENDEKQYAREYKFNMNSNQVECIRCLKTNPSKSCIGERNPIDFSLMVPVAENHNCVAFRVIENDKQLPKKTANKRKISNKENEPSIVKKTKAAVANVDESTEHENNENSPSEQTCNDILAPPSEVASNISTVQSDLASTANSNVTVKNQEFNYVKFFPPSGYYLDECCAKLKIPYSCEAVNFWSKIEILYIAKDSVPRECHSVSEEDSSAFRCFSLLLTGSEDYYLKLKDTLLPYVCTNIKALGEKHNLDLVRPDSPLFHELVLGRVASKIHFEALVMLLGCRIGIFENGQWDRYGNWENTVDKSCIVLLQKTGGTFGVILSFNN